MKLNKMNWLILTVAVLIVTQTAPSAHGFTGVEEGDASSQKEFAIKETSALPDKFFTSRKLRAQGGEKILVAQMMDDSSQGSVSPQVVEATDEDSEITQIGRAHV